MWKGGGSQFSELKFAPYEPYRPRPRLGSVAMIIPRRAMSRIDNLKGELNIHMFMYPSTSQAILTASEPMLPNETIPSTVDRSAVGDV